MSTMDVSVILRLVDQITGPAKKAGDAMVRLIKVTNEFKKVGGSIDVLPKKLQESSAKMRALSSDVRQFSSSFRSATDAARAMNREISTQRTNLAQEVKQLKEIARLQRQLAHGTTIGPTHVRGGIHSGVGLFGGYYGARMTARGLKHGMDHAGDLESEMMRLKNAGYSAADTKKIIDAAFATSVAVPVTSTANNVKAITELNYAMGGHLDLTLKYIEPLQKLMSNLTAMGEFGKTAADQVYETIKSAELKNYVSDGGDLSKWLDMVGQAAAISGGRVNPQNIFQAFKYSRDAVFGYSKEFMPYFFELVQELATGGAGGGGRGGAGTAFQNFYRIFGTGTVAAKNIPYLLKSKLIDPRKVIYDKKGNPKGLAPDAFYGNALAKTNPKEFMEQYIFPAMKRMKVDMNDPAQVSNFFNHVGGTMIGKFMGALMTLQWDRFLDRAQMQGKGKSVEEQYANNLGLYNILKKALTAQATDLAALVFMPFMKDINRMLAGIVDTMGTVKRWLRVNQDLVHLGGMTALTALPFLLPALLRAVFSRGVLGMVLGGGVGSMMFGPGGAIAGAVLGKTLFSGSGAAAAAAGTKAAGMFARAFTAAFSTAGLFNWKTLLLGGLMAAKGDKDHTLRSLIRKALGIEETEEDKNAPAPWEKGGSWEDADKRRKEAAKEGVEKNSAPKPLFPDADEAGKSWAQRFLDTVKGIISSSSIPGPNVVPPSAGAMPGLPGGGNAMPKLIRPSAPGGAPQGGTVIHAMHINVHGGGDPQRVAHEVHRQFADAVGRALSDHA